MADLSFRTTLQRTAQAALRSFTGTRLFWVALVGLIFAVGLAVRLYDLADPPLDFHATRQLHSALIARGMYFEHLPGVPAWQREMAVNQWRTEGVIEPQVFERLVAWTYARVGSADLRIPRLYAIFFWLVGAAFVTALAVEFSGWWAAVIAAFFFLIWPYGVSASRAFQPEPLMMALLAAALWAALRWERRGRWGWAVGAGLLAGLAIYVKSVAVFLIGPALAVLVLARGKKAIRDPQVWLVAVLALLPYLVYLLDGVYLHRYLVDQFQLRFFPQMWGDPAFYLRWISNLGRAIPFEMALVALLGALLVHRPAYRGMLLAMWLGYLVYGLTLPHHISTHDYYHLPLFPVVALGLGATGQLIFTNLNGPRWFRRTVTLGVVLAALVVTGFTARTMLKRFDAAAQAQVWTAIGEALGPGASVVALVPDYGGGLRYWAWITPNIWQTVDEIQWRESIGQAYDFHVVFDQQAGGKDFFVVTQFDDLDHQPELKETLVAYPIYRQGPGFVIYDIRSTR